MIRRDALSEYVRGSLWVLPTLSVLVALVAGSLLSEVSIGPHSPLAFQGTSDDARDLPRAFRTAYLRLIHAADCRSRCSSRTCFGVRY